MWQNTGTMSLRAADGFGRGSKESGVGERLLENLMNEKQEDVFFPAFFHMMKREHL